MKLCSNRPAGDDKVLDFTSDYTHCNHTATAGPSAGDSCSARPHDSKDYFSTLKGVYRYYVKDMDHTSENTQAQAHALHKHTHPGKPQTQEHPPSV